MPYDDMPLTRMMRRFTGLLAALRDGPLSRPELLARLDGSYKTTGDDRRRDLERDIIHLARLGISIEKTNTRPPIYTLRGGMPAYSPDNVLALAIISDSFGDYHPYAPLVYDLLNTLTKGLPAAKKVHGDKQHAVRTPLQPAIDYTRHNATLARLNTAINARELISFSYRNSRGTTTIHRKVEPYNFEFYDRHFYLIAYSHNSGQIHDFRIDRIDGIDTIQRLSPDHSDHERPLITFRYRLAEPLARGEISQRFEDKQVVERLANGDVVIEAQGRNAFFIVRTLLKYAGSAELLEPAWLRAKMVEEYISWERCMRSSTAMSQRRDRSHRSDVVEPCHNKQLASICAAIASVLEKPNI